MAKNLALAGFHPKLQVKKLRMKTHNFRRCHPKTASKKSVGGKYSVQKAPSQNCSWKTCRWKVFSSEGAIPKLQVKNSDTKYHPKTAHENSCVCKVLSQNWRPNTESSVFSWQPEFISNFLNKMLYLSMPNAYQAGTGKTLPMTGPEHHNAWTETPNSLDLPAYSRTETSNSPDLPAYSRTETSNSPDLSPYGRTETSNSPDLSAYGRTETSNSPDLPAYGGTVRQTYVRPAGPSCLWPDRPPALELTKLLNSGKRCSTAAENIDTEKNLEAALFSLFLSH